MSALKIAVLQTDLAWENPAENRANFITQFQGFAGQDLDLVVLPEMFTTGFSMQPQKLAETMQGESVRWMQNSAMTYNFLLTGSLIIADGGKFFNRQIFAFPNGELQTYDKRHLFRMGGEHKQYSEGEKRTIVQHKNWRILPQICYDLRFPVFSRNRNEYDLAIYVANFPEVRREVWNTLLKARAIENQCFVVGCNRIGVDGSGLSYAGDSQIISPKGKVLALAEEHKNSVLIQTLSLENLQAFRNKFPVHLDADA